MLPFLLALYHSNILTKPIDFDNQKQVLESGVGFINIPKGSRDESYTKQVMSITVEKLKVCKVSTTLGRALPLNFCLAKVDLFQW